MQSPPDYRNVLLQDLLKFCVPEEFKEAANSFQNWPIKPPPNPYRTYHHRLDVSGSEYTGEYDSKLRKSGYGHCHFINGDLYHGLWSKDQMDAFGCYWWARTGTIYVGQWRKGRRHGHGSVLFGPLLKKKAGKLVIGKWYKDNQKSVLSCQQLDLIRA